MYKHQWVVVQGIARLRERGYNVSLRLVGAGSGWRRARRLLDSELARSDPDGQFVEVLSSVRHEEVPGLLATADIFVFASSCENMPNTLVEGMAAGLPIACSNRGPMPEVLRDGGTYFDPEDPESIALAIEEVLLDREFRRSISRVAKQYSANYSWQRCAEQTWRFLHASVRESRDMTPCDGSSKACARNLRGHADVGAQER